MGTAIAVHIYSYIYCCFFFLLIDGCSVTFYQGSDYSGTSYGPWGIGEYTFVSNFADNTINSFVATASSSSACVVTMYSGCCPLQGDSVEFDISAGETRYVNRDTTGDSGSTSIWSDGSLWVSGIAVSLDNATPRPTPNPTARPTAHPTDPS